MGSLPSRFKALIEHIHSASSHATICRFKNTFSLSKSLLYSGWSGWSKWSPCSKSCRGIQQRYRHCLTNQQNKTSTETATTNDGEANEMEKSDSAATTRNPNQQLCNGYNIEQRECNLFECKGRINKLLAVAENNSFPSSAPALFSFHFVVLVANNKDFHFHSRYESVCVS